MGQSTCPCNDEAASGNGFYLHFLFLQLPSRLTDRLRAPILVSRDCIKTINWFQSYVVVGPSKDWIGAALVCFLLSFSSVYSATIQEEDDRERRERMLLKDQ